MTPNLPNQVGWDLNSGYGRIDAFRALQMSSVLATKIIDPFFDFHGAQGQLPVKGVIQGSNFAKYKLEYGLGLQPQQWVPIQESNMLPVGEVLGTWNIEGLELGNYLLRLTATDSLGQTFEDRVQVDVEVPSQRIATDSKLIETAIISGRTIVWSYYQNGNSNIYSYDLDAQQEIPVSTRPEYQNQPDIWHNKVVWVETNSQKDSYAIYLQDLKTHQETRLTQNPARKAIPSIYEDKIVWQDERNDRGDIYMYDLSTHQETGVIRDPGLQSSPFIWKDKIVFVHNDVASNGSYSNFALYLYDINTHQKQKIRFGNYTAIQSLLMNDRYVVWVELNKSSLSIYDMETGQTSEIQIPGLFGYSYLTPTLESQRVVFLSSKSSTSSDLYEYQIKTKNLRRLTYHTSAKYSPSISNGQMVWQDDVHNKGDIYMMSLGLSAPVIAPLMDIRIAAGQPISLQIMATDKNQDLLSMTAVLGNGDALGTVNANFIYQGQGTGTYSWTPSTDLAGQTILFKFKATNPDDLTDEKTLMVTVLSPPTDSIVKMCYRGRTILVPSYLMTRYLAKGAQDSTCSN